MFLGPDNGLLSWAIHASGGARVAHELTNEAFFLKPVSPTFHGRDLFAPVAAHLAIGHDLAEARPEIPLNRLVSLPAPTSLVQEGTAEGEVLSVDRHGNTQLSISAGDLATLGVRPGDTLVVWLGRRRCRCRSRRRSPRCLRGSWSPSPTRPGWSPWRSTPATPPSDSACRREPTYDYLLCHDMCN